jgi:non-heme chloroperoxidase
VTEQRLPSGVTLHLTDRGEGRAVVFVHGVLMSSRFFERQVEHFSTGGRMVAPDLRGHGRSEKVLRGHTVETYAKDLGALFAERRIERPVLVGWSMGAMVAWEYLKAFGQESVAGLVVVDQPPSDWAWEGYEFGGITAEVLAHMIDMVQTEPEQLAATFADLMQHEPDPEASAWMVEEITMCPPAIAATILVNQTLRDYRPFLPEIRTPTAVFFGGDEKMTSPRAGEFIAGQIPGASLTVFERSSHLPFWEEPEEFNRALDGFLAGIDR